MKLALVTPRYGAEIASGAEHACRLLAEQLSFRHDVEVLTTTARDHRTWKNEYSEGADRIRGVLVRRFAVNQPHDTNGFRQFSDRIFTGPRSRAEEMEWVRRLGPSVPGLVEHLKRQHRAYDTVVFFSLIHWTTVHGIAAAPERSVIVPCVRLTPVLRFGLWRDVIASAAALGLVSGAERKLLHSYVGASGAPDELVGLGIDPSHHQGYPRHQQDPADEPVTDDDAGPQVDRIAEHEDDRIDRGVPFRRRHRLYGSIVLYGGRVEPDNGCEEMLEYFDTYAAMRELLEHVRGGGGPAAIELDTERFFGHFEGDPQRYRGKGELDRIREERDCLKAFRASVSEAGLLDLADLDAIDASVAQEIDIAVAEARAAPPPDPATVAEDVYVDYV